VSYVKHIYCLIAIYKIYIIYKDLYFHRNKQNEPKPMLW